MAFQEAALAVRLQPTDLAVFPAGRSGTVYPLSGRICQDDAWMPGVLGRYSKDPGRYAGGGRRISESAVHPAGKIFPPEVTDGTAAGEPGEYRIVKFIMGIQKGGRNDENRNADGKYLRAPGLPV